MRRMVVEGGPEEMMGGRRLFFNNKQNSFQLKSLLGNYRWHYNHIISLNNKIIISLSHLSAPPSWQPHSRHSTYPFIPSAPKPVLLFYRNASGPLSSTTFPALLLPVPL